MNDGKWKIAYTKQGLKNKRIAFETLIRLPVAAYVCAPSMGDSLTVKVRYGVGSSNH